METINRYTRSYFSGFCEIWHWKQNNFKTIAFALVKIASYATLVVPATMFGLFLLSELMGRVSKKDHLNEQEQKISKVANDKLPAKKDKENVGNESNHKQPTKKKGKKTKSSAAEPSKHEESEGKKSRECSDKESQVKKSVQESSERGEPEEEKLADEEQHVRSSKEASVSDISNGVELQEKKVKEISREEAQEIKKYITNKDPDVKHKKNPNAKHKAIDEIVFSEDFLRDPLFYTLLFMIEHTRDYEKWGQSEEFYIVTSILLYKAQEPTFRNSFYSSLQSVANCLYGGDEDEQYRQVLEIVFESDLFEADLDRGVSMLQDQAKEETPSFNGLRGLGVNLALAFKSAEGERSKN